MTTSKKNIVLVTGAGKGIGKAFTEILIKTKQSIPNLHLVLTSRTENDLLVLKKLAQAQSIPCEIIPAELETIAASLVSQAQDRFGGKNETLIHSLVHCAGVGRFEDFLNLTLEDLQFVMKTNVEATFVLLQSTYREMKKQKSGQIQVVTSVAAEKPFAQSGVYCMSKYAQKGLLEVMRLYGYQDGIRICEVKPGAALTPMWGEVNPEMKQKMMTAENVGQAMLDALLLPSTASVEEITIRPLGGDL